MLDYYIEKLLEGRVESLQEPVHDAKINAVAQDVTVKAHRLIWPIMKHVHGAIHRPFIFPSNKSHATLCDWPHLHHYHLMDRSTHTHREKNSTLDRDPLCVKVGLELGSVYEHLIIIAVIIFSALNSIRCCFAPNVMLGVQH